MFINILFCYIFSNPFNKAGKTAGLKAGISHPLDYAYQKIYASKERIVGKNKNTVALRKLEKILRAENPREDIIPIVEELRKKIFRENNIRDIDQFIDEYEQFKEESKIYKQASEEYSGKYAKVLEKYGEIVEKYIDRGWKFITEYRKVQRALNMWRGIAVALFAGLLCSHWSDTNQALQRLMNWIIENRQWLFSGVGVTSVVLSVTFVYRKFIQKP